MTQQEKDKEIECTIHTSIQLAIIMGIDTISLKDIYIKTHDRCPEITSEDVSHFIRMCSYDIFEENDEPLLRF